MVVDLAVDLAEALAVAVAIAVVAVVVVVVAVGSSGSGATRGKDFDCFFLIRSNKEGIQRR